MLPVLALSFNAFTWGVSWWPFRQLEMRGLHPLWATALIYAVALIAITLWRRGAWADLWRARSLWLLVLAAGTTNATFNWAVTAGDVVRVVLLFYLMPVWAVVLARLMLNERINAISLLRVTMALAGAGIVLGPAGGSLPGVEAASQSWLDFGALPLPRSLPEWLAVLGGFSCALNNVLLRREAARPEAARALAMFLGGAVVSAGLALALGAQIPMPPPPAPGWIAGGLVMALAFLAGNLALQYGAARLPANVTAVVMITEVLFAAVSAVLLGAGSLSPALLLGGALIVGASLLAGYGRAAN